MTLENILTVLEASINGRLADIDPSLFEETDVRDALTTHFSEQQARPELTSVFKSQTILHNYLGLNLEEREELEAFRQEYPEYLEGEFNGRELYLKEIESEEIKFLIRMNRYTSQILEMFDFYLENREEVEVFNMGNEKLNKEFGDLGKNIHTNAHRNFREKGGIDYIVRLVAEQRPEILKYTTFRETLKIDGIAQVIRMFDFYLENREEGDIFTRMNRKLKERFGNLGRNIYCNALKYFESEGGLDYIVQLAAVQRPEILEHWVYHPANKPRKPK